LLNVLVLLANGFEEIEAISIVDILRRAGIVVTLAGVETMQAVGAHEIGVKADRLLEGLSADEFEMIILPGGVAGTEVLMLNSNVQQILKDFEAKNLLIGAICAAPLALDKAGVLKSGYTCYPSYENKIKVGGYTSEKSVVHTQNIITSRGAGTAICFALQVVKELLGRQMYNNLKDTLLADYCD